MIQLQVLWRAVCCFFIHCVSLPTEVQMLCHMSDIIALLACQSSAVKNPARVILLILIVAIKVIIVIVVTSVLFSFISGSWQQQINNKPFAYSHCPTNISLAIFMLLGKTVTSLKQVTMLTSIETVPPQCCTILLIVLCWSHSTQPCIYVSWYW